MPRNIDEAWDDDGFADFEPVEFCDDDLDRWLNMIEPSLVPIDREQLRLELTEIGTSLRCGHRRGARSFTIRQATKALETLLDQPTVDCGLVARLNGRAQEAVHNQLLMMDVPEQKRAPSLVDALATGEVHETSLREAARRAIDHLNTPPKDRFGSPGKKLSRQRDATLPWAVEELCKLWEQFTGELVTSWNEEGGEYSSHATSKSGRWVTEIVITLTSKHSQSRTRLAIRDFVRKRKNA
ncbi:MULTISPECIES: hypothetical protein [Hyphobacterium]|uniref:DUF222 domain-containing protein n=1 Tax=Hyphobacterium vulgare TaxID=1736751 RepID=A0ABV6ZVV1_9PROT